MFCPNKDELNKHMIWHVEEFVDTRADNIPSLCQLCGNFLSSDSELEEHMITCQQGDQMAAWLANPMNVSGETLNTLNADTHVEMEVETVTSPWGLDESENNTAVTDTHTQIIPGEMDEGAGDTMV